MADDEVEQTFPALTPLEQEVLRFRFGLAQPRRYTLREISEAFAVSHQRVHQIEKAAMRKLRAASY